MFARSLVKGHRVCVLGAAGGIGQPLSLLLKSNKMITDLSLYDVANVAGVAADLSHICTPAKVKGYAKEELKAALEGMDIVLIPAGVPRKPGMTRDELFATNAGIVRALAEACAEVCPNAHLGIISNPVNSTMPIAAEVYKKKNVFNPRRMYGITTLDILRANTFVAEALNRCPSSVEVNVIGGHSGSTIVPLLSQCAGTDALSKETIERITYRVQFGGDEVVKAKNGAGSATLSMAMAASRFTTTLLRALHGEPNQKECTYVFSEVESRVPFFSSVVTFSKDGVASIGSIGTINEYEKALLEKCIPDLQANIEKGIAFAKAA